jgi:hypothetical protein
MSSPSVENRNYILPLLLILGLLLRLAVLPFGQMAHGDAVSRIFLTIEGLDEPLSFFNYNWGMLYFFLMAAALKIWFDPIHSPVVLNILISVSTTIPFYYFIRREWSKTAAIWVSAASLLYPVGIRQSFIPLTETPFVFFAICSLNFISCARQDSRLRFVLIAGFFHTLACALRMEAWLLIPLYGALLLSKPKNALIFAAVASIYPLISMTKNYLLIGDPLPWITALRGWIIETSGWNEGLSVSIVIQRLIYFPSVIFFGLTPLLSLVCFTGAIFTLKDRKSQRDWLIPPVGLLLIFIIQAARGYVVTDIRFSMIFGYLLLPFAAEVIQRFRYHRRFLSVALLILLSILPLSYSRVVLARTMGPSFPNPFPADLEFLPKVSRHAVKTAAIIQRLIQSSTDGLIIDFTNWRDTRYAGLMSRLHPSQVWFMPGARYEQLDLKQFSEFIHRNPTGVLTRSDDSRHIAKPDPAGVVRFDSGDAAVALHLTPLDRVQNLSFYRYSLVR